jgi:endonuclease/exonuclease/phosphatase family metal-dependent hydrolase
MRDAKPPRMFHRVLVLSFLVACGGTSASTGTGSQAVSVETYNLYLGFDLTTLVQAQSQDALFGVVTASYHQVESEFPKRKEAIADEIARTHADLIGLQEVVTYEVTPIAPPPPGAVASNVTIDFATELLAALDARGQHYVVASSVTNATAQLPGLVNGTPSEIRLTDHDMIFARDGVQTSNPQGHNYATNLSVTVLGQQVTFTRGWVSVDVQQGPSQFRFMSTHLETEDAPPIQVAQATELLGNAILGSSTLPTILVGDFNSRADDKTTPTHEMVLHTGFSDAWATSRPNDPGFTCCQAPDLTNPTSMLDQRIDYVFTRGLPGVVDAEVVGNDQNERNEVGLWPSDHASVVATLTLPQ